MSAQVIRIIILVVIGAVLLVVNISQPRPGNLVIPVIRIAIGVVVGVVAARLTGLWRSS